MSRKSWTASLLVLVVTAGVGTWWHSSSQADEKVAAAAKRNVPVNQELRDFMRKKLEASNDILEGLATDDTDLIEKGATKLSEMSATEHWRVSKDAMYKQFSDEFTRNADKLKEAAKEKNIDRAALRWMDTTMSCIECHRFVRNVLVVNK